MSDCCHSVHAFCIFYNTVAGFATVEAYFSVFFV